MAGPEAIELPALLVDRGGVDGAQDEGQANGRGLLSFEGDEALDLRGAGQQGGDAGLQHQPIARGRGEVKLGAIDLRKDRPQRIAGPGGVPDIGCLEEEAGELGDRLDDEYAWQHRETREVIVEHLVGQRDAFNPTDLLTYDQFVYTIHQKETHEMFPSLPRLATGVLLLSSLLGGCGYTQNVRAYRAYAYESPSLDVALDRTEDLAAALELVDRLLTQTPLSPGDAWLGKLALTDAESKKIREELRQKPPYDASAGYEIPIIKIYRVHLEHVLEEAKNGGSDYPSLLDAVGALGADSKQFKAHWRDVQDKTQIFLDADAEYEKVLKEAYPPGRARNPLQDPPAVQKASQARNEAKDALRDAEKALERDIESIKQGGGDSAALAAVTAGVSVAYRIDLEALAMLPIIAVQVVRSLPSAKDALSAKPSGAVRGVSQLMDVPDHIDAIKERMTRQTRLLELLTGALVTSGKTSIEATAGFVLKESVVDQVVGVTLDSFRAQAKAGGEAFFFQGIGQDEKSEQKQGDATVRKDLTGRLRTLNYKVGPILLAAFNLNLGFDYIHLPNAVGLNFGYKTDRVFSSGGTIESGSLGQQFGLKGAASDALDFGLGVLGVRSNVRLANFTTGTVTYADAAGNNIAGPDGKPVEAPLQISFTQIDLGYDLAFALGEKAGKYYLEELIVGARYFRYELPRVLYELENTLPPESQDKNFVYLNETLPQTVSSLYYMGGATGRFGKGEAATFSPFGELGFYIGGGPTAYTLRNNKAVDCSGGQTPGANQECVDSFSSPGTKFNSSAIGFDMSLALGLRVRLAKPGRRFRLNGEVVYRAELVYANASASSSDTGKERQIDFGNADLFHGPRFNLVGEF